MLTNLPRITVSYNFSPKSFKLKTQKRHPTSLDKEEAFQELQKNSNIKKNVLEKHFAHFTSLGQSCGIFMLTIRAGVSHVNDNTSIALISYIVFTIVQSRTLTTNLST